MDSPWTVQVIQANVYIVNDISVMLTDIRNSSAPALDVHRIVLLDKTQYITEVVQKSLSRKSIYNMDSLGHTPQSVAVSRDEATKAIQFRILIISCLDIF